ncbi:hypothetical protein ACH5RR_040393 [Cinchona calisaya]|uniref:Uncharacterized protein n=1 Tax=Cinchona calisaya TaxID=153742 RepID=A0ABD2XRS3_9GENT
MADAILGVVTESVLGKVLPLAVEEIGLALVVKSELKNLEDKLEIIQALLSDAQSKQLTSSVQLWLKKLKSVALDADIILDEFGYEVLRQKIESPRWNEVCRFFSSNPLSFRVKIAHKIKNIKASLEEAFKEANQIGLQAFELTNTRSNSGEIRLTHPFVDDTKIVGRDDDISLVKRMLTSSVYNKDLPVIAIVGMGGQGKTTLAQLVYKNDAVVRYFDERIWFCVSNDFKVERLLNEMLQSLIGNKVEIKNCEALVKELKKKLKDKRYLLVLDDVWNENQDEWESMRNCLLGIEGSKESKIMERIKKKNLKRIPSKLRTLILNGSAYLEDILTNFRYLTTLIVQDWKVEILPDGIGEMKLLRYLDITETRIYRLPDLFTKLYNLQTLRVNYLKELPEGFGNLINLRNFYTVGFFYLSGISQLTNLQTLSKIEVVKEAKGFHLEELEHLDNLRGKLEIHGLENVSHPNSAAKANLWRKPNIQSLELSWYKSKQDENGLEILEDLKPHSNLKSLKIKGFHCSSIPSWMVTKNHLSVLCNLVKIELRYLPYCKQIPSLGDLPYLQIIELNYLPSVECIGNEFYGCSNLDGASSSSSHETAITTLFPALRKLQLWNMNTLLEWSDSMIPSSSSVELFPFLEELDLFMLPNLDFLPNLGNLICLQRLEIRYCENLTRLPISKGLMSLQELTIDNCLNLTTLLSQDSDEGLQSFGSVKNIVLKYCPNLDGVPDIHSLQSLRQLRIEGCDQMEKRQVSTCTNSIYLSALRDLVIENFDIPCLQRLELSDCWNLKQLPSAETMQCSINLQQLRIRQWPLLKQRCSKDSVA